MMAETTEAKSSNQVKISKAKVMEIVDQVNSITEAKERVKSEFNLTIANVNKLFKDLQISKAKNQILIIED